ncbi:hypothetical protein [Pseudomonas sp. SG-MS2]|uniref:hypothetical protein n=1 Tax=Pseudomonas sp. SG-MS2 TaxID=1914534 RepID=UPI00137ACA47|nr:hypothetical protein [Pseudomonas sp. SG-MS2]
MSAPTGVLGVSAMCWVDSPTLHSYKPRNSMAPCGLCRVCKVCARARVRAQIFIISQQPETTKFSFYARNENPYKPYTPYTDALEALIFLVSVCVGFVLGMTFLCWVGFADGEKRHD